MADRHYVDVRRFHAPLMDAGLVPLNCRVLDLSIALNGALTVRYEIFLTAEQVVQLGQVFQDVGTAILTEKAQDHGEDG